ncbi:MAG: aromatic ring-hydroxylating dioxygenase subunit alpha [Pseudomonadales bacterium]
MLINNWYVAEWSDAITDKPVKVKMLGQNFVVFRDSTGKVNCLSDVCIHRGASLSGGQSTDRNCVACPYHGWEFDGQGQVQFIPSLGEGAEIPDKARIDAYPTEEHYGMVWVFLGDLPEEERYPIPPFPEYEDKDTWRALNAEFTWQAPAAKVVENGIDIAHASFVHPGFGYPEMADKNHISKLEKGDWYGESTCVMYPPKMKGGLGIRRFFRKDKQETQVHPSFYLPGFTVRLQIDINSWMTTMIFDANTPVDEFTTRTFVVQLRSFFKQSFFDKDSRRRLMKVFEEDAAIVEAGSPNYLPERMENEMSVKQDRFMGVWRNIRRRHIEELGWQVDTDKIDSYRGKKSFALPSPQRRSLPDMEWVMDTVPLVDALVSPIRVVDRQAS